MRAATILKVSDVAEISEATCPELRLIEGFEANRVRIGLK
jgi:hypothetical protein